MRESGLFHHLIEFWRDEDSAAWEEGRKVNTSSVGAVVAGLEEMRKSFSESTPASAGSRAHLHRALGEVGDAHSKRNERLATTLPLEAPPERLKGPYGIKRTPEIPTSASITMSGFLPAK